jgi:hypothetical protein
MKTVINDFSNGVLTQPSVEFSGLAGIQYLINRAKISIGRTRGNKNPENILLMNHMENITKYDPVTDMYQEIFSPVGNLIEISESIPKTASKQYNLYKDKTFKSPFGNFFSYGQQKIKKMLDGTKEIVSNTMRNMLPQMNSDITEEISTITRWANSINKSNWQLTEMNLKHAVEWFYFVNGTELITKTINRLNETVSDLEYFFIEEHDLENYRS